MQEETFGSVSSAFKTATTGAVRFAKGKLGAEKRDVLDAIAMARALIVILRDSTKTSKMDDVQTTVKNLVYLQKHSSPEEAEIFAAALYRMQQGGSLLLPFANFVQNLCHVSQLDGFWSSIDRGQLLDCSVSMQSYAFEIM